MRLGTLAIFVGIFVGCQKAAPPTAAPPPTQQEESAWLAARNDAIQQIQDVTLKGIEDTLFLEMTACGLDLDGQEARLIAIAAQSGANDARLARARQDVARLKQEPDWVRKEMHLPIEESNRQSSEELRRVHKEMCEAAQIAAVTEIERNIDLARLLNDTDKLGRLEKLNGILAAGSFVTEF